MRWPMNPANTTPSGTPRRSIISKIREANAPHDGKNKGAASREQCEPYSHTEGNTAFVAIPSVLRVFPYSFLGFPLYGT